MIGYRRGPSQTPDDPMARFPMTIKELLDQAALQARQLQSDATLWDARLLLAHVLEGATPSAST